MKTIKVRPVALDDADVRHILAGTKTQIRTPVVLCGHEGVEPDHGPWTPREPSFRFGGGGNWHPWRTEREPGFLWQHKEDLSRCIVETCPLGMAGDKLWVQEPWNCWADEGEDEECDAEGEQVGSEEWRQTYVAYEATPRKGLRVVPQREEVTYLDESTPLERDPRILGPWMPADTMPRWAARLFLKIRSVCVHRLHDTCEGYARAECPADTNHAGDAARTMFKDLWILKHGINSWRSNPWVWAVSFKVAKTRSKIVEPGTTWVLVGNNDHREIH